MTPKHLCGTECYFLLSTINILPQNTRRKQADQLLKVLKPPEISRDMLFEYDSTEKQMFSLSFPEGQEALPSFRWSIKSRPGNQAEVLNG